MIAAGGYLSDLSTNIHVSSSGRRPLVTNIGAVSVAQLAMRAVAPTAHAAAFEEGARVGFSGCELRDFAAYVDVVNRR
jgi:hypothetical protein